MEFKWRKCRKVSRKLRIVVPGEIPVAAFDSPLRAIGLFKLTACSSLFSAVNNSMSLRTRHCSRHKSGLKDDRELGLLKPLER